MKIVSRNVRGLGGESQRMVVEEQLRWQKVQIVLLWETKLKKVSDSIIKEVWGSRFINWVAVDAVGYSEGMPVLWDKRSVSIINSRKDLFSPSVLMEDLDNKSKWLITSVYGPNEKQRRQDFCKELEVVRGRWGELGALDSLVKAPREEE